MNKDSAKGIWEAALGELQVQVSKPNFDTWLKDTVGLDCRDGWFTVGVSRPFAAEWLEKRLYSLLKKTIVGITGHDLEVRFEVSVSEPYDDTKASVSHTVNSDKSSSHSVPTNTNLNPKHTFSTFVAGSSNHMAYAAAMAIVEQPGVGYNPLFIHSRVGLGKTHLLHAIGHAASSRGLRVLCTSTEQFTNEFVEAIRGKETDKFRSKFRSPDVLLLDDVHFISGKEQTQEGFFHTFNELHNSNRQIVITCDRPPKSVPMLEDRLCSRFQGGLIVDIQPPDHETCIAILRAKALQQQVIIDEDVFHIIAEQYDSNIRELEGGLNRVIAYAKLTGEAPTADLAHRALQVVDEASAPKLPAISPFLILEIIGDYFRLSPKELTGRKRAPQICEARQLAMYVIREEVRCPLTEIGKVLGGRDHSTILQGYKKVTNEIQTNQRLQHHLENIMAILLETCVGSVDGS